MTRTKCKEEIRDNIRRGIEAITDDICQDIDPDENLKRSEAIKNLVEAFKGLSK